MDLQRPAEANVEPGPGWTGTLRISDFLRFRLRCKLVSGFEKGRTVVSYKGGHVWGCSEDVCEAGSRQRHIFSRADARHASRWR
jgi:hypothetical protein